MFIAPRLAPSVSEALSIKVIPQQYLPSSDGIHFILTQIGARSITDCIQELDGVTPPL